MFNQMKNLLITFYALPHIVTSVLVFKASIPLTSKHNATLKNFQINFVPCKKLKSNFKLLEQKRMPSKTSFPSL